MGVKLTTTAVHPDNVVRTQLPGNTYQYGIADIKELPELSWLPNAHDDRDMFEEDDGVRVNVGHTT